MADGALVRVRRLAAGVRFRTTAVAVAVVAIVVTVAVVVLTIQTRDRLESNIESSAAARAEALAALWEAGAAEPVLPGSRRFLAQIVAADGEVLAASPGLEGIAPFTRLAPAPGERIRTEVDGILEAVEDLPGRPEDEGPYAVVVLGARGGDGPVSVQVAATLESAADAVDELTGVLVFGVPLLLAVVGALIWVLTGRALRPVDAMAGEAQTISAAALDRRLPVPGSSDEIHRLAETLNAMLDRLEASTARQRRFVADASHELKSPVATIRAMLEVADQSPDFDEWRTLIADLLAEDARLERLVADLLTLARTDEGAPLPRREEVDLDQIVGREADAVSDRARVHTAALRPVRMWGDPDRLAMVFRNLASNAARYGGEVWFESRAVDGQAVVSVSDDGPGIPAAERERVFERFVRLDEARARGAGGTGLGLAVCRAIARAHGGDVQVVEPRHGGATLEVRLPLG